MQLSKNVDEDMKSHEDKKNDKKKMKINKRKKNMS